MKTLNDLTDLEFEALGERMYKDFNCVSSFVIVNYEDFEEMMYHKGINPDYYCDYEIYYCEKNDKKFMEFAFNFFNKKL